MTYLQPIAGRFCQIRESFASRKNILKMTDSTAEVKFLQRCLILPFHHFLQPVPTLTPFSMLVARFLPHSARHIAMVEIDRAPFREGGYRTRPQRSHLLVEFGSRNVGINKPGKVKDSSSTKRVTDSTFESCRKVGDRGWE